MAITEGEPINSPNWPALLAMFRQIIANNRAGGWRKIENALSVHGQADPDRPTGTRRYHPGVTHHPAERHAVAATRAALALLGGNPTPAGEIPVREVLSARWGRGPASSRGRRCG
ncbi:hypothetical protein [Pseudonocardia parietis]|uniref:Uncharacterized protein n=1 Tax=Pseudonocardia parietis TaxID=570936 RepID=A0ABS4W6M9_9PSEU|nr:hypothetical protein [Pseudonocardia parietis]MBP2371864.1 hypothetical protein [Pseudonocardia parietis]